MEKTIHKLLSPWEKGNERGWMKGKRSKRSEVGNKNKQKGDAMLRKMLLFVLVVSTTGFSQTIK